MKKILTIAATAVIFVMSSAFSIQAIINWKIDAEKAQVKFSMQAHGQELIGNFKNVKGDIAFDENDLANSSVKCAVDVNSINTGIEGRDKHLQARGFFDAATTPQLTFTSAKIEKSKEGFIATGNLSVKQTTKEIAIPFTFETTKEGGLFKGSFAMKRTDYGVGNADGDIGDDITVLLEIPVTKM
jgi:polyisoprenoid-binding protein YceI